jgi:hypothetical protein
MPFCEVGGETDKRHQPVEGVVGQINVVIIHFRSEDHKKVCELGCLDRCGPIKKIFKTLCKTCELDIFDGTLLPIYFSSSIHES